MLLHLQFQGPIVSENLLKLIRKDKALVEYEPQVVCCEIHVTHEQGFLSLMMTGDGQAISSWKGLSVHGRMMWWTKDKIDRSFMDKFDVSKMGPSPARYI